MILVTEPEMRNINTANQFNQVKFESTRFAYF